MSTGFSIAMSAFPFLDLLDKEVEALIQQAMGGEAGGAIGAAAADNATLYGEMNACRRRLSQGVDAFIRSLPTLVRNNANTSQAAAYALVGLADERMLHHSSGGLEGWRERLLEYELYGSALAGQEIVSRARSSAQGFDSGSGDSAMLAPLYLAVFRSGFEGSLRGDVTGLALLINTLEQAVGAGYEKQSAIASDLGPKRSGLSPTSLAIFGFVVWLFSGLLIWSALPFDTLQRADLLTARISEGLPALDEKIGSILRRAGPSGLPPIEDSGQ